MSQCTECSQSPCCCQERRISVIGRRGPQGLVGEQGPQGEPGAPGGLIVDGESSVFGSPQTLVNNAAYAQVTDASVTGLEGDYLVLFELVAATLAETAEFSYLWITLYRDGVQYGVEKQFAVIQGDGWYSYVLNELVPDVTSDIKAYAKVVTCTGLILSQSINVLKAG